MGGELTTNKMGLGGEGNSGVESDDNLIPVTLLCGFLGSGKTTLLKYILETKHEEEDFKCAVIVNDMAELNIDKSLIDNTSLIQSDEAMVGMQNGCICCTLQSDLVEQIIQLTQNEKQKFNYILIEASGVSEPHEIAPLFEIDNHEHDDDEEVDHDHDHSKPQLGEVARLDTCVTLIDSSDFYNNLGSMKTYDQCEMIGTIAELMMDQVEFANVIILNKSDLVNEKQQADLMEKVSRLNTKAKIVKTTQSKINVKDILDTKLYTDKEEFWVTSTKHEEETLLKPTQEKDGKIIPQACTARFDISSFVYRARKPFHPGRILELFLEPYFMDPLQNLEDEEEDEERKKLEEEKQAELQKLQAEALVKQDKRKEALGELLRSKGFFWIATTNDIIGGWQQAGNVLRIRSESPWMCLMPQFWEGTKSEPLVRADMTRPDGEEFEYKDRRQEIVFIGHEMNREAIQSLLDECLLTDEEMALGPEMWRETMGHLDQIQLTLADDDDDEEEENEECQDKDCEDKKCEKKDENGDIV